MIARRALILTAPAAVMSAGIRAQAKPRRVGFLGTAGPRLAEDLRRALGSLGWVEGRARTYRMAACRRLARFASNGGLLAYAAECDDLGVRAARFVDLILRGSDPANLPVERPTVFTHVLNLKTASAIGVTLPQTMIARADQVIE